MAPRTFVRRAADADQGPAPGKFGQEITHLLGSADRIEFRNVGESRRGGKIVLCSQGHHQIIGVERVLIGCDAAFDGIYRGNSLLQIRTPGLVKFLYGKRTADTSAQPNITSSFE